MNQLSRLASRALFLAAFVLAGLAVWEKLANHFGRTLVFLSGYVPSRLLELAAVALLFVIALQLREIKHLSGGTKS
jgi:hypothetical protein